MLRVDWPRDGRLLLLFQNCSELTFADGGKASEEMWRGRELI